MNIIPSNTVKHLDPNTVKRLREIDNIVGIKDSSGQFETIESYIQQCREDFIVLSGTDSLILPTLKAGGSGGIAATSNVIPEIVVSIYESLDRKSTRLNSSHVAISYAVFCLK